MNVDHNQTGDQFDYAVQRHSIPVAQNHYSDSPAPHGMKRKISADRPVFVAAGEETDPQLVGPGVPSNVDSPPPKRRGSTVDTQRIAQLSLYDQRRNSVDSRTGTGQLW